MNDGTEKLVKRAQKGDKDAFLELIGRQKLSMSRAALAILHNEEDAADAIAETVLTAFQKLCGLREPRYFKTWLTRVLICNCTDILRRQRRMVSWENVPEAGGEQNLDEGIDIRQSLSALAENDRLVLTLHYLDDLPVKDIARMLGVKEGTVKTRLLRGRERFRKVYLEREAECCEVYEK